jgi:hypothetical protein
MKFTKAAILYTLAAAANVNAHRQRQRQRSAKAQRPEGTVGLDDYRFPTSADFTGKYELCFQTRMTTTRLGSNSIFNICRNDDFTPQVGSGKFIPVEFDSLSSEFTLPRPGPGGGFFSESIHNITIIPADAFNAYQAKVDLDVTGAENHNWNFQGYADRNKLVMQSFGVGDGVDLLPNNTPDDMSCTLYNYGVLGCTQMTQEYCGIDDPFEGCNGAEGEWLETNSIYSVLAKDISDCPQPPADFCPNVDANPDTWGPTCVENQMRLVELGERNTESAEEDDSHRRLVTDHDEGVVTHVPQSKDSDRLEWIKNHIAERMDHMEAGGKSGWDPLIEEYFKRVHSKDIEIDCSFAEGSFKCNSSSKTQCGQDLIKGHADLHEEFAAAIQKKQGNPEFVPRDVPDSCV